MSPILDTLPREITTPLLCGKLKNSYYMAFRPLLIRIIQLNLDLGGLTLYSALKKTKLRLEDFVIIMGAGCGLSHLYVINTTSTVLRSLGRPLTAFLVLRGVQLVTYAGCRVITTNRSANFLLISI